MRGQVPRLAEVSLETITPLHIGAGRGGGKPFDDECLERTVPSDYRPPLETPGPPEFVRLYRRWRDQDGNPYVPGSSLRGFLRALYTGALDARGVSDPDSTADEVLGSTEQAGAIALNDLLSQESVSTFLGGGYEAEFVEEGATFSGQALYVGDALLTVLETVFAQTAILVEWLCTGSNGQPNPEREIEGSPIHVDLSIEDVENNLFVRAGDCWTITWKLGRYAKSYAKALSTERKLQGGAPYDYNRVRNQIPGWVRVTFDLAPTSVEFKLNQWSGEETR